VVGRDAVGDAPAHEVVRRVLSVNRTDPSLETSLAV
jgi:hypothetical protein